MSRITSKTLLLAFLTVISSSALGQTAVVTTSTKCLTTKCVSAPEIDPAQALGALTLLTGAVAVMRGFRRKGK